MTDLMLLVAAGGRVQSAMDRRGRVLSRTQWALRRMGEALDRVWA